MHLGDNIKAIRREKKITQDQLVEACGMSKGQLSKLESNKQDNPQLKTLVALSTALGVSLERLVFNESTEKDTAFILKAIDMLSDDDQKIINEVVQAFVSQKMAEKVKL